MKQQLTMLALLLAAAMPVLAQGGNHAVIPWDYHVETPGFMSNRGDTPKIVWSDIISVPVASALLVHFDTVELGSLDDKIVLTSLKDGCVQELDQRALKRWGGHSAWFNGNQLRVSLRLAPGSTGKLAIRKVAVEATSGTSGTLDSGIAARPPALGLACRPDPPNRFGSKVLGSSRASSGGACRISPR